MSIDTAEQYEIIRNSIGGNINTIRSLVMQIDSLNALVLEMEDDETKAKFEHSIKGLYATISMLIDETNTLLNEAVSFAKKANQVS